VRKAFTLLGLATSGAAALVYARAKRIAELEQRPLTDVLAEMPGRIATDLSSLPDDLREAAEEGKRAASRRATEIDEEMHAARAAAAHNGSPPDAGR
jgi:hypothetical protein